MILRRQKRQGRLVGGYRPGEDGESWLAWFFDQSDVLADPEYQAFGNEQGARNWVVGRLHEGSPRAIPVEWGQRGEVRDCFLVPTKKTPPDD